MSVVTGVMLICSLSDGSDGIDAFAIAEVQCWLKERFEGLYLRDVSQHAGGGKAPQFAAFCGGFNYMGDYEDEFASFVTTRLWIDPEEVVLVLRPEDGPCKVYRASGSMTLYPEDGDTLQ